MKRTEGGSRSLRRVLVLMVLMLVPATGQAWPAVSEDGPEVYDNGDTESVVNQGWEMVYSRATGQLMQWFDPAGEHILNNQGERPNSADALPADGGGPLSANLTASDPLPFRFYLFRKITGLPGDADPFVHQPLVVCEIPNDFDHIEFAYPPYSEMQGDWYYQEWYIRRLFGEQKYQDPRLVAFANRSAAAGDECTFQDDYGAHILTVSARTYVGPFAGTHAWANLHATFTEAINEDWEHFGILAIEWPILTGLQGLPSGALAWPTRNGILLNNALATLFGQSDLEGAFRFGDQEAQPITLIDAPSVNMFYPYGYDLAAQFFAYYQPGQPNGFLWYTSDTGMKAKRFVLKANNLATNDYSVSFVHFSDHVCSAYLPGGYLNTDEVCAKHPFGPIDYEVRQVHFSYQPPGQPLMVLINGNWMDAAKWYRTWVRSQPASVPWLADNTPIVQRDDEWRDFYRYTGFTLFNIGAEFALADPIGDGYDPAIPAQDDDNFLRQYYKILYAGAGHAPMVNYVLGWDFHHSGIEQRVSGLQNGKCGMAGNCADPWADWEAAFGPLDEQGVDDDYADDQRMNRNVILPTDGSPALGYVTPYLFSLHMNYAFGFEWSEWTQPVGESSFTPWLGHRNYPNSVNCSLLAGHGACVMDATDAAFFDHFVDRSRHLVLDPFDVDPADENNPDPDDRISGLYHDIGVSYAAPFAFRSHPADGGGIKAHHPGSAIYPYTVQIGVGGFVWEAQRALMDLTRHNPESGDQDQITGTEQMTEIFIDQFDTYGAGENSLGPLRPYSKFQGENPVGFVVPDKWIMEGSAREIPMLQYVYHPMMPIRLDPAWFSGGSGTTYDGGDIYYWIVAREYFEYGSMISMFFSDAEMDVLSDYSSTYPFLPQMDANTPSYRLGWARSVPHSEQTVPLPKQAGKHPPNSSERAVAAPAKMAFLRMAAAIRSYLAPSFLVYGEMRTTGIAPTVAQQGTYSYYHFSAVCAGTCTDDTKFEHCSDQAAFNHCQHGRTPYPAERVVTASWQDYQPSGTPTRILHIVANLWDTAKTLNVAMSKVPEFSNPAYYRVKIVPPTQQNFALILPKPWQQFNPGSSSTTFTLDKMPARSVALILVCQDTSCGYQ